MTQGLLKKLALAAPLVLCLPLGAVAADGVTGDSQDTPKIFEEFSLTSATMDQGNCVNNPAAAPTQPCAAAPSCGAEGCASCCPEHCCQFIAGVEATFFHASTHGMHANAAATSLIADPVNTVHLNNDEGLDQWTFSPRVFAGVQDNCWGVLGRFWYLSDSEGHLDPFNLGRGAVGTYETDRLKAYTADLEVYRAICLAGSKVNVFLGARYASFEAGQGLDVSRLTSPTEIGYSNVFTSFAFNGVGITTGFLGRTPIGCDTCISLLWGVRGSVLWGTSSRNVQTSDTLVDTNAAATSINAAQAISDGTTAFIIEAMLGFQWDHELRCLPMSAYLRIAAEYQFWDLGSNGSAAATSVALSNTGALASSGSVGNVDANLLGFTVGTGFNW